MVGGELLSQLGVDAKTVECLELLDRLLPKEAELAVESVGRTCNEALWSITVRLKRSQSVLSAKMDRPEGSWSCIWVFYQREAENAAKEVLRDFGRVRCLKCSASDETFPLCGVPRFSSQDEFKMKVMLKGGAE